MTIDLDVLASRLLPVTTHDTPDYAEVSFGDVKSQTMTMEPEIFLMLNALPDLIAAACERDGLREALTTIEADLYNAWLAIEDEDDADPVYAVLEFARQALNTGDPE